MTILEIIFALLLYIVPGGSTIAVLDAVCDRVTWCREASEYGGEHYQEYKDGTEGFYE